VGFEEKVEGMTCVVMAVGGGGRAQGDRDGRWLPGSGARREYAIAFGRRGAGNAAVGRAAAEADARGGGEALGAGCGPAVGGRCVRGAAARVVYGGEHLEIMRCVGLVGAVEEWLDVPATPAAGRELSARASAPGAGGTTAYPSTTRWRRRCGGTAPTPR